MNCNRGKAFITLYKPVAGWKAVCMVWDEEEREYFPEQTGFFAYADKEKAIVDGKAWAEAEELPFYEK